MKVVGFDFGTTNSLISVVTDTRTEEFLDYSGRPFPSVVRYDESGITVGREAKEQLGSTRLGVHGDTVVSPKFHLGEDYLYVGGADRSPVDVVGEVIRHVKSESLAASSTGVLDGVQSAVVTIPVDMDGPRRRHLREAFALADISVDQFVHEPFAALYAYFRRGLEGERSLATLNRRLVLVVDWGGGTLDLTLCRVTGHTVTQVRNSGFDDIGGDVFDDVIRNAVVTNYLAVNAADGASAATHEKALRFLHQVEAAKRDLSVNDVAYLYETDYFAPESGLEDLDLDYTLKRAELEEMVKPLVDLGVKRVEDLLEQANVQTAQVAMVLVVGGATSMPLIREQLGKLFGDDRLCCPDDNSTLIAQGAAWIAHDREPLVLARTIEVELARQSYLPLIKSGTPMPRHKSRLEESLNLFCADPTDGTAKIRLCSPMTNKPHPQPGEARESLGLISLDVDPLAKPFRERIDFQATIDQDLILRAEAVSGNVGNHSDTEYHWLQFGITLPSNRSASESDEESTTGDEFGLADGAAEHRVGDTVVRVNVTTKADERLIPGDVLKRTRPSALHRGNGATREQVEESLYYELCECGQPSNSAKCRCKELFTAR